MADHRYSDSCAISLPRTVSPVVDGALVVPRLAHVVRHLNEVAAESLTARYPHARLLGIDWTFCYTPADVDAWPLPHDCHDCRECKSRSVDILVGHPELFVALGHLFCEGPHHG